MPIYKMEGKKDGRQKYRVRINYSDVSGASRQLDRVAYGVEAAKDLERRLLAELSVNLPDSAITLRRLHEEYKQSRKKSVRETTAKKSETIIDTHVTPYLGEKKLDELTTPVLQRWKNEIDEKDLSLTTKQNIYAEFRALLNFGVRMGYLSANPLLKVGNFKDALHVPRQIDYYTTDEFQKFIRAAEVSAKEAEKKGNLREWHYYVFFAIAFYTGMRKGEIHGLQWDDIDKGYITVRRSVAQKLDGPDRVTPPKNNSSIRTLQLPAPLIKILNEHKKRCEKTEGFTNQSRICGLSSALRDTTVEKKNKDYAEKAGIKKIRIHDFRHSHASLLANEGINIQEIARRLGHSNIEITWNRYSHLYPREEERAIQILNKIV